MVMQKSCCAGVVLLVASGCAVLPPPAQLTECLQPNRRVDVEVSGTAAKPVAKPQSATAQPAKPNIRAIRFQAQAQGDSAFDAGAAVLKSQGTSEFDRLTEEIAKRNVHVGSIIVIGHTDKLEAEHFAASLSEDRAKAVVSYLESKGMDPSLMFWEGKGASDPLPVTKFCD
jgi:OOP family OmpA-OmpF porin